MTILINPKHHLQTTCCCIDILISCRLKLILEKWNVEVQIRTFHECHTKTCEFRQYGWHLQKCFRWPVAPKNLLFTTEVSQTFQVISSKISQSANRCKQVHIQRCTAKHHFRFLYITVYTSKRNTLLTIWTLYNKHASTYSIKLLPSLFDKVWFEMQTWFTINGSWRCKIPKNHDHRVRLFFRA